MSRNYLGGRKTFRGIFFLRLNNFRRERKKKKRKRERKSVERAALKKSGGAAIKITQLARLALSPVINS